MNKIMLDVKIAKTKIDRNILGKIKVSVDFSHA
jgi:hypothetical protein